MSDKRPIMSINENEALELLNNIFENAELLLVMFKNLKLIVFINAK